MATFTTTATLENIKINEVLGSTLSTKYTAISTNEVIAALEEKGFVLSKIMGGKLNRKNGGTKAHIVRMRLPIEVNVKGDIFNPEIVIWNSLDGSTAFKIQAGLFRLVCSNGMTICAENFGFIRLRHSKNADEIALQVIEQMADTIPQMAELVEKMREKVLTEQQAITMATIAARIRWNKEFSKEQAKELLEAARPEDGGLGLWEVLNVLQEKCMNGGTAITGMRKSRALSDGKKWETINAELFKVATEQLN